MLMEIDEDDFIRVFRKLRPFDFSLSGLKTLYKYLTNTEDYRDPIILDVHTICDQFVEYSTDEAMEYVGKESLGALDIFLPVYGTDHIIIRNVID